MIHMWVQSVYSSCRRQAAVALGNALGFLDTRGHVSLQSALGILKE